MGILSSSNTGKYIINKRNDFKYPITIEKRLEFLEKDQSEKIIFNVGGSVFKVSRATIENSKYNSFFKEILKNDLQNESSLKIDYIVNKENNDKEIFIDKSFEQFEVIINILRSSFYITNFKNEADYELLSFIKKSIGEKEIFRNDLKYYFKKDFANVIKDYDLTDVLILRENNSSIDSCEIIKPNRDERIDFMFHRAHDYKELFYNYCIRGIFIEQTGCIILKFEKTTEIKRIEIKPFLGDSFYWNIHDCPFIKIYKSNDKTEWKFCGNLSFKNLDNENFGSLSLNKIFTIYLKISSNELGYPFAISGLKIY